MRSRDLSSIGGETDQNLPDDNMSEQEGEDAEHTDNDEEDNEENEESDEDSDTENEAVAEEKQPTAKRPPPVKVQLNLDLSNPDLRDFPHLSNKA